MSISFPLWICSTEVVFVPAAYVVVEKALVSNNMMFRVCSNVFDFASFKPIQFAQPWFPQRLVYKPGT